MFCKFRYLLRQPSQRHWGADQGQDQTKAHRQVRQTLAIASILTGSRAIIKAEVTAERTYQPSASSRYSRADGVQAYHALTFKPAHAGGADQEGETTMHLKGKKPVFLTKGRSLCFDTWYRPCLRVGFTNGREPSWRLLEARMKSG